MAQNIETVSMRKIQVENDQNRERVLLAIQKCAGPVDVINRLTPVPNDLHRIGDGRGARGAFEKENVVVVVFNQSNGWLTHVYPFCNSTQNRLPWFTCETTPTAPFIRSTALRTMANPIPVPS